MTRPAGLADIEQHVMASEAPAVCLIDRDNMRKLLAYVHFLEARQRRTVFASDEGVWR